MEPVNLSITEEASDFVFHLMKSNLPGVYVYHNYRHTTEVVDNVRKLSKKSGLSDEDTEIVTLAAWFHDSGFIKQCDNHEDVSIEIATKFLKEKNYPEEKLDKVIDCINATRYPTNPQNVLEEIICDADLFHLGTENYEDKTDLLRLEWEKSKDKIYTELEWLKLNIDFLTNHKFYTRYAKKNLEENKLNALLKMQKAYRKRIEKKEDDIKKKEKMEIDKLKIESKKDSGTKADRGIETMFRNTVRTHVEFSGMADNKANIMISINTLIIGGIVTVLLRKLDTNPQLIIPTLMLVLVSLVCIVFGVLVTRPNITSGKFTTEDIKQKRANLLFFGNFFNMGLKEFQWGMQEMMNDKEFLYGSMIKDFYFLGQVLGRKYKYLRICYTIFMYGLIASVIAYIIAFMFIPVQDFEVF
ncbi:MAG: HD domain-containing protein [Ignavibacteriae bacterium]|nr:HD domain-containing protein [Ignavibacteriota bacterium]